MAKFIWSNLDIHWFITQNESFWVFKHVPWSPLAANSHGCYTRMPRATRWLEMVWVKWAPLWMPQHSSSSCSQWLMAKMFIQKVSFLIPRQIFNIHHSVSAFSLDFYRTLLNTFPPPHLVLKISLQNVLILYQNRHQNRSFNDPPEGGFYYFLPAPKKKKKKNQT